MSAGSHRVAIIGTRGYPSYYGGFETAVRKLAPYLASEGWDVDVYCRPGVPNVDEPGIRQIYTKGVESKSLSSLSFGLTAGVHAARSKPDVALIMNVANGFFLPLLKARGIPTLVNVDGMEWERAKWGRLARATFKAGAHLTARFADELVFDAEEIRRRWQKEFRRDGVFIPYGGDANTTHILQEDNLERGTYVLVVARFVPENTIPEFFRAVQAVSNRAPVVIVGSGGYGGPLDSAAKDLDSSLANVRWLGHVSDDARLHALWANAGVYFHGHSVGGTNPALVQAMALGAPTVARDTPYNRETLGEHGIFCSPDPESISQTVLGLIEDKNRRAEVSLHLRERAAERYSWELVNRRYAASLTSLIAGRIE